MILETKQVLFRAHVHSLDRRSRNAHDHFEQTINETGGIVNLLQISLPAPGKAIHPNKRRPTKHARQKKRKTDHFRNPTVD